MNEPARSDLKFTIDVDIRVARTLPARVYSDPHIFRAQRDVVFARTWQYAAHDDVVKVAGQVYPFTLQPGSLDEPLLLTRDAHDRVNAISNVCTHRGTLVVEGPAHEQQLRCRYHGRRFSLDGRFHSMPEFDQTVDFPSAADDLPRVALGRWERFLMVALSPAMTFDDVVAPMRARLAPLPFDQLVYDAAGARDYVVSANWALYIDNYLEGFQKPSTNEIDSRRFSMATQWTGAESPSCPPTKKSIEPNGEQHDVGGGLDKHLAVMSINSAH